MSESRTKSGKAKGLLEEMEQTLGAVKEALTQRHAQERNRAKPSPSVPEVEPEKTGVSSSLPPADGGPPPLTLEYSPPLAWEPATETVSVPASQETVLLESPVGADLTQVTDSLPSGNPPDRLEDQEEIWLAGLDLAVDDLVEEVETLEAQASEDRLDASIAETVREETEELVPAIAARLQKLAQGESRNAADLHRLVHTLKGVAGMAGAMRTRALIHRMEARMEEAGPVGPFDATLVAALEEMFAQVRFNLEALFAGPVEIATDAEPALASPKTVRMGADTVDRLFNEINEARLAGTAVGGSALGMRRKLRDLEDHIARVIRMARELEIQAETQIQSRLAQLAEHNEDFDPLEWDQFTLLQEQSRLLAEAVNDVQDLHRDLARSVGDQETHLAHQERSILEVQDGLHKVRLVSVDTAINDRLHKVALSTARELGKSVVFSLVGGRVALDRAMLEKIASPLEHLLRNAVAHGVESPMARLEAGKPSSGQLRVAVRQEASRVTFVVEDDGAGLDVNRIRAKAVEKGLFPADAVLDERQAADFICLPGFSTAATVSQVAGRGVGMDAVRSEVLAMGGRFELASRAGRGLRAVLQLPTTVAALSVLVVEAGGETWSVPAEVVDDVKILRGAELEQARATGGWDWEGQTLPFAPLAELMGVSAAVVPATSAPVLLLREGDRRVAVETGRLSDVVDVALRPLSRLWAGVGGIVGATLLPDGRASFLVDPMRAPWGSPGERPSAAPTSTASERPPLVLVVDDSITVRKATARFLERHGFEAALAKDGQEALEMLAQIHPVAMLLDVEMPRMDGFECARGVRENPRHRDLPILMITSRTAPKHRERAMALGVDAYLGKPFQEEELLALLQRFAGKLPAP